MYVDVRRLMGKIHNKRLWRQQEKIDFNFIYDTNVSKKGEQEKNFKKEMEWNKREREWWD